MKSTKFATSSLGFIFKLERESKKHCAAFSQHTKIVLCVYGRVWYSVRGVKLLGPEKQLVGNSETSFNFNWHRLSCVLKIAS